MVMAAAAQRRSVVRSLRIHHQRRGFPAAGHGRQCGRLRRQDPRARSARRRPDQRDLQTGRWVFGVQAEVGAADLRGETTCFSGIGGVNCQQVVNSVVTVAGRFGWAWDRALIYAKAGGAWTATNYSLMANTNQVYSDVNPLTFGTGGANVVAGGWVAGGGLVTLSPIAGPRHSNTNTSTSAARTSVSHRLPGQHAEHQREANRRYFQTRREL